MATGQLPHLETFVWAAELSSFTAAARELMLTQAAVSQRVQMLEQELGVALFQRQAGRILLTAAGHTLYDFAQRILGLHAEARAALTGKKPALTGELHLAASSVPGEHLLPAILKTVRQRYPHVHVRATVQDSRAVLEQVEQGRAHLGLLGGKGESPHLEYRAIGKDELGLVVSKGNAWYRRKRVPLEQFLRQPLIVREEGSGSRWCLEQALAAAGKSLNDLNIVLELGSNEAIKEAVLGGLGIAVLSVRVVEREVAKGDFSVVPVAGLSLTRDLYAVWDRRRALPIPARLFLDLLLTAPERSPGAFQK